MKKIIHWTVYVILSICLWISADMVTDAWCQLLPD